MFTELVAICNFIMLIGDGIKIRRFENPINISAWKHNKDRQKHYFEAFNEKPSIVFVNDSMRYAYLFVNEATGQYLFVDYPNINDYPKCVVFGYEDIKSLDYRGNASLVKEAILRFANNDNN